MDYIIGWKKDKWLVVCCCMMTVLVLLLSSGYVYMTMHKVTRYQVFAGTELIGAVSDKTVVSDWLKKKREEAATMYPTVQTGLLIDPIHYLEQREYKAAFDNEQVLRALESKVKIQTKGVQVVIDGQPLGYVKDAAAVNQLFDLYKSKYVQQAEEQDGLLLKSVEFVQQIQLVTKELKPGDIDDNGELLKRIETGGVQPVQYTVQRGDCISCIAYKFHISQKTIYDNNPSIKSTVIRVGDVLNLTVLQPLLTVKTVTERAETVEVPYDTQYIDDPEMKAGNKETVTDGESGLKEVHYLTTRINGELVDEARSDEALLKPAKQAVVRKGTKVIPGVGTGVFAWPVYRAKLTSEYGRRWGSFHPGTDMVSEQSGILASDHGKVAFAGWKTGYGNCVIIDHQNGYSTLYGHMSKIVAAEGELVQKGEKIGIMGQTGNATGVHLHFEVRKGEKQLNPLTYLAKADD
ncbi:M23 family metallopeptidase [Paenibacillus doosanensis]|uniref:M23 family metallopeptidase n=1 Tax=Paenibacillus doosanensis TaxID=1229154 RepID=UPI00217F33D3|nr:M23 family metallopeptidase [Paenibacillus doosanensis]MCS7459717.1 M23 family metallopeptidase [Paenibacillus doosanensis]